MWMLVHLPDLESDFSVFHRISDVRRMPSRKFVRFGYRIGVYQGVIASIAAEQQEGRNDQVGNGNVRSDPAFAGLID